MPHNNSMKVTPQCLDSGRDKLIDLVLNASFYMNLMFRGMFIDIWGMQEFLKLNIIVL